MNKRKSLLDQASKLAGLGFGLAELERLRELLAEVAPSQGTDAVLSNGLTLYEHDKAGWQPDLVCSAAVSRF